MPADWETREHVLAPSFEDPPELRRENAANPAGQVLPTLRPLAPAMAGELAARFAAMDPWAAYGYPANRLAAYLGGQEPGAPRFAVCLGPAVAGAAGLRLAWLKGPYLQFLGLLPEHQGRGLGGTVLHWLEREAREGLGPNVWVCVSEMNRRAFAFYRRHGFEHAAALPELVCPGKVELLLRKRVG